MKEMHLKVTEASVHTAQVQVKTLTISGKQVTLAVFRQLLEESVLAQDGNFQGLPWGTVNYHFEKKCKQRIGEHLHVVWQSGDELRRAWVDKPSGYWSTWPESGEAWLNAALLNGWRPTEQPRWQQDTIEVKFEGGVVTIFLESDPRHFLSECFGHPGSEKLRAPLQRSVEEVGLTLKQLEDWVNSDLADASARHARIQARWQELQDIPQLFIAV